MMKTGGLGTEPPRKIFLKDTSSTLAINVTNTLCSTRILEEKSESLKIFKKQIKIYVAKNQLILQQKLN